MILTYQKGKGTKIHILLDDTYQITTDADFWVQNYIENGTEIDDLSWQDLVEKINDRKAFNKAVNFLSRRDHSEKELRDKLLRSVDEESADKAINKMLEYGYLDDEKYVKTLVEYLFDSKKYSASHVRQECIKRGIDKELIDTALSEKDVDNVATLVELLSHKYQAKLTQENGLQKVIAALVRKGFRYSDIKTALNRIENEEEYE